MSNEYFSLNYDPAKQGFDNSTWRKVFGDVAVVGGKLQFTQAFIIHYGDILRGDAIFNINIGAPLADGDTKFGFTQYSKNVYAYFKISGPVLTAETSDGVTSSSKIISWSSAWTDTNTEFRIKWETGAVHFHIAGVWKATIDYSSVLDIPVSVVPNDPMSLSIYSDSTDLFLLNYITVVAIQSFLMSEGNADSIFEPFIRESDRVTISEAVTMSPATIMAVNKSDIMTVTDAPTVVRPDLLFSVNVFDSMNITNSF